MTAALIVIADEVIASTGVRPGELFSRSRVERVARARQIVYYLAHRLAHMTQEQIGQLLGRDHAAVCCGEKRIQDLMSVDKPFAALVEQIRRRCEDKVQRLATGDYNQWHDAVMDLSAVERTIKILSEEQTSDNPTGN